MGSCYGVMLCFMMSYYVILCHITSYYVMLCHITSHHITSYHITSHHITSYHIIIIITSHQATMKILYAVAALYIVVFSNIPELGYLTVFDSYVLAMFLMLVSWYIYIHIHACIHTHTYTHSHTHPYTQTNRACASSYISSYTAYLIR